MSATDTIGIERLEALLAGAEPGTPAEARRAALVAELRGGALRAPEVLRSRLLARATAGARRRQPLLGSRGRALLLVPAVLALALLVAGVHGLVSPSPRPAAVTAEKAAPSVEAPASTSPALGVSSRAKQAQPVGGSSRTSRVLRSAAGFLALEGLVVGSVLVVAGLALALARVRSRREERRLLGTSPAGRRGDLME